MSPFRDNFHTTGCSIEPYAYLRDLFTKLANGHLDKDINELMPWAYAAATKTSQ